MLAVLAAIHLHQINVQGQTPLGNKIATATIVDPEGITTMLPTTPPTPRPAIVGDVYSIQPDGTIQGRQAGTASAYEIFVIVGASCVWAPLGVNGTAFIAPFTADMPNA